MCVLPVHSNDHSDGAEIPGNWPAAWAAYCAGSLKKPGSADVRFVDAMVDEGRVVRLYQAVRATSTTPEAAVLLNEAGRMAADFLLANRIPWLVQTALVCLPAPVAARFLLSAITGHTWTFAGSGSLRCDHDKPVVLEITGNPFCAGAFACTPVCFWHVGVLQRLFQALVSDRTRVSEVACEARGDPCCRFVVDWRG